MPCAIYIRFGWVTLTRCYGVLAGRSSWPMTPGVYGSAWPDMLAGFV